MNKKLILLLLPVIFFSLTNFALADTITLPNPLCTGLPGSAGCIQSIQDLISSITTFVSNVIGILAILMFVIAGIMFVISAGNPGKIETAKKMAIYAAWGVGIALAGNALVMVIKAVIGAPATP